MTFGVSPDNLRRADIARKESMTVIKMNYMRKTYHDTDIDNELDSMKP